jgi:hypothetical protein
MEPVKGGSCVNIGRPGSLWTSAKHAPGKDNAQFMIFERRSAARGSPRHEPVAPPSPQHVRALTGLPATVAPTARYAARRGDAAFPDGVAPTLVSTAPLSRAARAILSRLLASGRADHFEGQAVFRIIAALRPISQGMLFRLRKGAAT